jgi:hypothetical protein
MNYMQAKLTVRLPDATYLALAGGVACIRFGNTRIWIIEIAWLKLRDFFLTNIF